ncbi:hypothetical protein JCM8202_005439 [Rhodotorula sphaerocarpa]
MYTRTARQLARSAARPAPRSQWTRAVSSSAVSRTPANLASVKTTQDALYVDGQTEKPAATNEDATEPHSFPYGEPLASERPLAATSDPASPAALFDTHAAPSRPSPLLEADTPVPEQPVSRSRRPVGAFRGGIIGFLLGLSAVGGYGYLRVLDDYRQASERLLVSVEELKSSTEQMAAHLSRITALESNLDRLTRDAAMTSEVDSVRDEARQLIESHHLDLLNLKAHVWGIEQDFRNLAKRQTSVRI